MSYESRFQCCIYITCDKILNEGVTRIQRRSEVELVVVSVVDMYCFSPSIPLSLL